MKIKRIGLATGARLFKILSDESRVRIINLFLEYDQVCMTDLEMVLEFTQTKTSRHLAYLRRLGVVAYRQLDQWKFYFVKDEIKEVMQEMISRIGQDPQLLKDKENYKILYSNRELAVNKINMVAHRLENRFS